MDNQGWLRIKADGIGKQEKIIKEDDIFCWNNVFGPVINWQLIQGVTIHVSILFYHVHCPSLTSGTALHTLWPPPDATLYPTPLLWCYSLLQTSDVKQRPPLPCWTFSTMLACLRADLASFSAAAGLHLGPVITLSWGLFSVICSRVYHIWTPQGDGWQGAWGRHLRRWLGSGKL